MRILHIALLNGAAPNFPISKAFQKHSDYYEEIDWVKQLKKGIDHLQRHILKVAEKGFDIIFMQIQTGGIIHIDTAKELRKKSFVINWTGDVRENIDWYINLGQNIDLTLFTNFTDVEKCRKYGVNADYLQVSCDNKIYQKIDNKINSPEIVFLANNYLNKFPLSDFRFKVVQALKKEFGNKFGIYGFGWEKKNFLNQNKECDIYNNCKIAINLSHFNYKQYSSDRLFRIMFSGAFCLSHNYKEIEKEFTKEHLGTFEHNINDLIGKCHYWLEHEAERKKIAIAGNKHIQKFTWNSRIKQLIEMVEVEKVNKLVNDLATFNPEKKYSQTGEEFMIERIFNHIPITNRYLVEFGAGDGVYLSNSLYFIEKEWKGLLMDGDNQGNGKVHQEHITKDNIENLFKKYNVPEKFDFLSIDLDGNDFWIWNAIKKYSPRVVIIEFNGTIGNESKTIKYNPEHRWNNDDYYGASFQAMKKLGESKGYTLVSQKNSLNMYFVKFNKVYDCGITYKAMQYHKKSENNNWLNI
jgi:hypothetical protein